MHAHYYNYLLMENVSHTLKTLHKISLSSPDLVCGHRVKICLAPQASLMMIHSHTLRLEQRHTHALHSVHCLKEYPMRRLGEAAVTACGSYLAFGSRWP